MNEHIEYIRTALRNTRGDDLERAGHSFKGLPNAELDRQYGQSGQTRREILESYRQDRKRHDAAVEWFETLVDNLEAADGK